MKSIRIGTRDSQLAMWQAKKVQSHLAALGVESELVPINGSADLDLTTPLYEMGITGVFTKNLDVALIQNRIDIAVHSMKDVPTLLPKGEKQYAVLPRGDRYDVLVPGKGSSSKERTIATGSLRRKAYWLNRFPNDTVCNLRGHVNTRLQKLEDSNWYGAVFAAAGLDRLDLLQDSAERLEWMTPAPSQGVVVVAGMEENTALFELCQQFNDSETAMEAQIERDFLRVLEGGCTAPIGASAEVNRTHFNFKGEVLSIDGKEKCTVEYKNLPLDQIEGAGERFAKELLAQGGEAIMDEIRKHL